MANLFNFTTRAQFQRIEITQVTGNGKVKTVAISPDGRYIGYVVDEGSANPFFGLRAGGKESLWLRQVVGGNEVQVAPAADADYRQLTFSHDGNFLYFIRSEPRLAHLKNVIRGTIPAET